MSPRTVRLGSIFLACLLLYLLVWLKTGFIPIDGGAGFDGGLYRDYIVQIAQGQWSTADPYRLTRMPGFTPAILAVHLGLPADRIVAFQAVLNAVTLAAAAAVFHSTIERLTGRPSPALWATVALVLSWPYGVMPVYYPLLSDHLALAASVLALWAWSGGRTRWLQGLAPACVFIMPGLSLIPLALLALPRDPSPAPLQLGWHWGIFALLALPIFALVLPLNALSDAQILHHPEGTTLGQPALKLPSMIVLIAALLGVAVTWTRILAGRGLWQRLAWRPLAAGLLLTGLALSLAWYGMGWTSGFRGPSLAQNLLLQSIAAPGKPLMAHALNYGPAFLLALVFCWCPTRFVSSSRSFTPFVAIAAFLPIFLLGSESRQWIYFFPLMLAFVALNAPKTLVLLGAYGVVFIAALFSLNRAGDIHQVGSMLWAYLIYQGPWMPHHVYLLSMLATGMFLAIYGWVATRTASTEPAVQPGKCRG